MHISGTAAGHEVAVPLYDEFDKEVAMFRHGATRITVITLVAMADLLWARAAMAANCGGNIPCACGDTVQSSITLSTDLGVCTGIGLRVSSGVVLDCANHTITGSNRPGAWFGVFLDEETGAEVRNCRVTGFRRAIRLYGGQGNRITDNEVFGNRYGIELAGATGNTIADNFVHDNRDEGIHVGTGADDNEIRGNTLVKNKLENLYLLGVNNCRVTGNTLSKSRSAALYIKHSHNIYVADNTVNNGPILVRGDSVGNVFKANYLRGNGYFFEAYEESPGLWTYPHDNQVIGGSVQNTKACLRFAGAYDNRVDQLQLDRKCAPPALWALGGKEPTGNVVNTIPAP
ncbi:MAG: right-handed parallel beta-helix repeat-containing protein [Deltaproteobacteria bacterium]|nr:right-handed parallel beta-helix repeat-containing protein [Deltaproteobacteria bacterium]